MLEADQEPPTDGVRQLISIEACSHQGFPITNLTIHPELVALSKPDWGGVTGISEQYAYIPFQQLELLSKSGEKILKVKI